jgi:hypothetical protein
MRVGAPRWQRAARWAATGVAALAALGCEALLGLDWTPAESGDGGGGSAEGGGGSPEDGGLAGDGGTLAGGGASGGPSGSECVVTECPLTGTACVLPACAAGACASVAALAGAPCAEGGGAVCDGAGSCVVCVADGDCAGEEPYCHEHACYDCKDKVQNGLETDIDCGGPTCHWCGEHKACVVDADCKPDLSCAGGACTKDD